MPVSSWGRGLPSSFIFRLSSASWDRYFCNHIKKNQKHCYQTWKYSTWDSLCVFRALTLLGSQKERKDIEAPFRWKLKTENTAVSGKLPEYMQSLRSSEVYHVPQGKLLTEPGGLYSPSVCVTTPHVSLLPCATGQELNSTESTEFC